MGSKYRDMGNGLIIPDDWDMPYEEYLAQARAPAANTSPRSAIPSGRFAEEMPSGQRSMFDMIDTGGFMDESPRVDPMLMEQIASVFRDRRKS